MSQSLFGITTMSEMRKDHDQTAPTTHDPLDDNDLESRLEEAARNAKYNRKEGRKVQRKLNMHVYTKTASQYVEQQLGSTYLDVKTPRRGPSLRKPKESVDFNELLKVSLFDSKDYIGVRGNPVSRALEGEPREGWKKRSRQRAKIMKDHTEALWSVEAVEGTP